MPPVPVPAVSEDTPGGGWAVSPHALYTAIQLLRSEVAASREEKGRLREKILELRTLIAVLDAVVIRHAANNAPSGEQGVRCSTRRKTPRVVTSRTVTRPPMTLSIHLPQERKLPMKMQMRRPPARTLLCVR
jgi:hypothetical protein